MALHADSILPTHARGAPPPTQHMRPEPATPLRAPQHPGAYPSPSTSGEYTALSFEVRFSAPSAGQPSPRPSPPRARKPKSSRRSTSLPAARSSPTPSSSPFSTQALKISDDAASVPPVLPRGDGFVALTASTFPTRKALANVGSLPLGAALSLFADEIDDPSPSTHPLVPRDPTRCARCRAFLNPFCRVDSIDGRWTCCFCGGANASSTLAANPGGDLRHVRELSERDVEYRLDVPHDATGTTLDVPSTPEPVVFLVDECLDDDECESLRSSLVAAARGLDPDAPVALATYAASTAVYDLSAPPGTTSADVVPGHRSPTEEDLRAVTCGPGRRVASMRDARRAFEAAAASLLPAADGPARRRPRCLGAAIETAAALLRGSDGVPGGGRVIVCAGGPATRGPGGVAAEEDSELFEFEEREALVYVDELATTLASLGVSLDVISGGREAVRSSRLARLAEATGGAIIIEDDFGASFSANLAIAARRPTRRDAVLSVRASSGVGCARVIGAAEAMRPEEAAAATATGSGGGDGAANKAEDSADSFRLKTADASQGLTVFFEYLDDLDEDPSRDQHVYLQFVLWRDDTSGGRVARCMTRRVPTTKSNVVYLRAVRPDVAALLAAKKAALDAQSPAIGPVEAADRVEARVLDVADVFSPLPSDAEPALLNPFPEELCPFAEAMYHLLRGPMLGRVAGHEDERAATRARFLDASIDAAAPALQPRLRVWRGGDAWEAIPPADLALRTCDALFLDHGSEMFAWIGRGMAAAAKEGARAAARSLASTLARGRFPIPRVRIFDEGSSAARYMVSRLAPLHRESVHEQDARFPPARLMTPEERSATIAALPPTEEPSFVGWMKELGLVAPPVVGSW